MNVRAGAGTDVPGGGTAGASAVGCDGVADVGDASSLPLHAQNDTDQKIKATILRVV